MKLTSDDILSIVERRISQAQASGMSEAERKQAIDYYLCRPRGDEMEGRSRVISADVADMVHATLAQLSPSFMGDQVCEFEPDAEGDEAQARLESDAVNKVLMESSRGYVVLDCAMKDALILGNAIVKVWAEDADGRRQVRVSAIDPLNFLVDEDHDSPLLEGVRSVHERKVYARGELLDMGFDREDVERLTLYQGGTSLTDQVRYQQGIRQPPTQAGWASELVECWESYLLLDKEGDGTLYLCRAITGQGVLLLEEPAEFIPYATGTALPQAHRWQGLSMHHLEKGVQDVKTAGLRAYIDNLRQSRTAANSDLVNIDDLLTERPKGVVRVKGPVDGNILDLQVTDLGPSAQALLQYMDKVRSERGGAALEMQSGEPGLVSSQIGAQNVADVLTNTELVGAMFARNLAETLVRSLFLLVHRLLRTEVLEPMTLRLADRWVTVDPGQWRERVRVNIKAGLSPGERRRKAASLQAVLQYQMGLLQAGLDGVLVSMPNLYSCVRDWCAAQGIDAGERYFTDPSGQASSQAVAGKLQQAQQQEAKEQQMLQLQVQLEQAKLQIDAQKAQLDQAQADAELKFNYWKEALHAEIEEAKLVAGVTSDLAAAQQEGRDRANGGAETAAT